MRYFRAKNFIFVEISFLVYLDRLEHLGPRHVPLSEAWACRGQTTSNDSWRLRRFCTFGKVVSPLNIDIHTALRLSISLGASHSAAHLSCGV